jgi:hypothetical protein
VERLDDQARSLERPGAPCLQRLPLDAAEALEHAHHGVAERALDARVAEDAHRARGLAQQEQPRRVVDLRVGEQHARDRRRTHAVDGLEGEGLELLTQVRRRVDQEPRPVLTADGQRRLRAGSRPYTRAHGLAGSAVAVPLRRPTSSGRAQNANAHGPGFRPLPVVEVGSDLRTQFDDLKLGLDPGHNASD